MLPVDSILKTVPKFKSFYSVAKLQSVIAQYAKDPRFKVRVLGYSAQKIPVHHVSFGTGKIKTLWVGYPHPNEPIGGLTICALLEGLQRGTIAHPDVEWHCIPCIDPDGARLNEGWAMKPFTFESFQKHYFRPTNDEQVEWSVPVRYKKLKFNRPTPATKMLMRAIEKIKPDFYNTLHNAMVGGAYFYVAPTIKKTTGAKLHRLMKDLKIPLHLGEPEVPYAQIFGKAIYRVPGVEESYDYLAKFDKNPQTKIQGGASTIEFLAHIKPRAKALVCELPYLKNSIIESRKMTTANRRKLFLRTSADLKFLQSIVIDEWDRVKSHVNRASPFYTSVCTRLKQSRESLAQLDPDVLRLPEFDRRATESERFDIVMHSMYYLCWHSQLIRLLEDSKQNAIVKKSVAKLRKEVAQCMRELDHELKFKNFRPISQNDLVKGQLGSGLILLNEVLEK